MKVLNLQCRQGHTFEGWFGSNEDFESQSTRGLVECPLCGDNSITKGLSAPRLNLGNARPPASEQQQAMDAGSAAAVAATPEAAAMQARWIQAVREVIAKTEDVGDRFADEARRIHYGETPERGIRGQATREQAEALVEEGIEVARLPLPDVLKQTLQ